MEWFSCELLSADFCLTQSAESISWTVHQVPFNSMLLVRVRTSKSRSVWFSCELTSTSCSLPQSAEVSHWAVHYVPAHSLVQLSVHFWRLLLVTIHTSKYLDCTSTSSCEHVSICQYISHCLCFVVVSTTAFIWESAFSCQLISADCRLTQSAEMTAWAVDQVPASRVYAHFCRLLLVIVRTSEPLGCTSCQTDSLSVIVLV